ncbi:MAG: hypothetical protein ACYCXF_02695 [Thermoleophilia bacterium]
MEHNLTQTQVHDEIATAEGELVELDGRALRLWERIKVPASLWKQSQYQIDSSFWVVAILGNRCMYFNHVERGWGWGRYSLWGTIESNHCQQDEIHHVVFQTLFAIDEGGSV